jgi:hypothetical protein
VHRYLLQKRLGDGMVGVLALNAVGLIPGHAKAKTKI